jgi:hypothetical protein
LGGRAKVSGRSAGARWCPESTGRSRVRRIAPVGAASELALLVPPPGLEPGTCGLKDRRCWRLLFCPRLSRLRNTAYDLHQYRWLELAVDGGSRSSCGLAADWSGNYRTAAEPTSRQEPVVSLGASSALPAVPTGRRDNKPHCTDYFPVGQSAEHSAVNPRVAGSSPAGGASIVAGHDHFSTSLSKPVLSACYVSLCLSSLR